MHWICRLLWGSIDILVTLVFPIQEHGISLHLFLLSLILFISGLQLSVYRSFVSLGRFILRYFIFFVAMVNEIVSSISLSDFSLLVCRNSRDFCVLTLYPVTLLNSLISLVGFVCVCVCVCVCVVLSANSESFTYSFPIWIPFISFSSLISMARTSKTILNNSEETGHPGSWS